MHCIRFRIRQVPWALLLCVTKPKLIQVSWHFSAYSHLCAQSTVSVYWLSWRPHTMCRGGCWKREEPNSSSNTRMEGSFQQTRGGNSFLTFLWHVSPFVTTAHPRAKNSPGQRNRLWIFPWRLWRLAENSWLFMPSLFFILSSDSLNAYCINESPNNLNSIFYYISLNSAEQQGGRTEMISPIM